MFVPEAHIQENNLNCIDYLSFKYSKTVFNVRGTIFSFLSVNKDKCLISPEAS
jgi:hypothetical protein